MERDRFLNFSIIIIFFFSVRHVLRQHHPVAVATANQTHSEFSFSPLNTSVSNPPVQFWCSRILWRCCCPQRWLECCHWHLEPGWWLGRDSPNEGYLKMDTKDSFNCLCFSLVFSSVTRLMWLIVVAVCCSVSLTLLHISGVSQIAPVCLIITQDRNLLGPRDMYSIWLNINNLLCPVTLSYFTYSILLQSFYSSVVCKSLLMPSLSAEMYEPVCSSQSWKGCMTETI